MSSAHSAVIGLSCRGLLLPSHYAICKLTFLMTFYNHLFPFLTHFMNSFVPLQEFSTMWSPLTVHINFRVG